MPFLDQTVSRSYHTFVSFLIYVLFAFQGIHGGMDPKGRKFPPASAMTDASADAAAVLPVKDPSAQGVEGFGSSR